MTDLEELHRQAVAERGVGGEHLVPHTVDRVEQRQLSTRMRAFAAPDEPRAEVTRLARDLRAVRDVELANAVSVIGDRVAPHMAPPDTDTAAARAADSLVTLPEDPAAAAEEIQRRREEIGFSYFIVGADVADTFAPVVATLAGQ